MSIKIWKRIRSFVVKGWNFIRASTGLPEPLVWIVTILALLALVNFMVAFTDHDISGTVTSLALILTLIVLIFYAYYTYLIAEEKRTPCASFIFKQRNEGSSDFFFILRNHGRFSVECWCNMNFSVNGKSVPMAGFYNAKHHWNLQPFSGGRGYFHLDQLLAKAETTFDELRKERTNENMANQFRFDVDFWYKKIGSLDEPIRNPRQPFFFDFERKALVSDV